MHPDWLLPDWPVPAGVGGVMTTRAGGCSQPPYDSMNLGAWVGDEPASVEENMRRLAGATGARPVFLKQVHGARVVNVDDVAPGTGPLEADASVATRPGVACTITVADCLPVLFAAANGRAVGAAHAGWRGLAGGVLENTAKAVAEAAGCGSGEVVAWLGPCIGPRAFEVGPEVVEAFGEAGRARFVPHRRSDGSAAWLGDLARLAHDRLAKSGLRQISGGQWCTVEDGVRFFSYRRDRTTGRLAAVVWLRQPL
jgi:hypothetical protein